MEVWERLAFGRPLLLILFPLGVFFFIWLCYRPKQKAPMEVWAFLASPCEGDDAQGQGRFDGLSFASLCVGWFALVLLVSDLGWRKPLKAMAIGLGKDQLNGLKLRFPHWNWLPSVGVQPWQLPKVLDSDRDLLVSRWRRRDWRGAVWNPELGDLGGVEIQLIPLLNELILRGADEIGGEKQSKQGQAEPVHVAAADDHYGRVLELGRGGRSMSFAVPSLDHGIELEHSVFESLPKTLLAAVANHRTSQPHTLALVMGGSIDHGAQRWCFHGEDRAGLMPLPSGLPHSIQLSALLPMAAHFGGLDWPFHGETKRYFEFNGSDLLVSRAGYPLVLQEGPMVIDFAWSKPPHWPEMAYRLLLEQSFPRPPLACRALAGTKEPPRGYSALALPQQSGTIWFVAWFLMVLTWSFAFFRAVRASVPLA